MEKGGNIKEQMGKVHRDMKILRKNQKEMLKIKNTGGNEECLHKLTNTLDMVKKLHLL